MRRRSLWPTRITRTEGAARNRCAPGPAAQRVGSLQAVRRRAVPRSRAEREAWSRFAYPTRDVQRMLLNSRRSVMSSRRIVATCGVMTGIVLTGGAWGVAAFPLTSVAAPGELDTVPQAAVQSQPRDRRPGEAGPPTAQESQLHDARAALSHIDGRARCLFAGRRAPGSRLRDCLSSTVDRRLSTDDLTTDDCTTDSPTDD